MFFMRFYFSVFFTFTRMANTHNILLKLIYFVINIKVLDLQLTNNYFYNTEMLILLNI